MFSPEYANIINNYLYAVNSLHCALNVWLLLWWCDYSWDFSLHKCRNISQTFFSSDYSKSFALHRGAQTPFSWTRNIWVPTILWGCGGHRRDRLSPSPFTLLNPPPFSFSPSHFSPFLPSPSPFIPLHPSCPLPYTFKATKRRGAEAGGRDKVGMRVGKRGVRRTRKERESKKRGERKAPLTLPFLNMFYKLLHSGHCPPQWQMTSMIMTSFVRTRRQVNKTWLEEEKWRNKSIRTVRYLMENRDRWWSWFSIRYLTEEGVTDGWPFEVFI